MWWDPYSSSVVANLASGGYLVNERLHILRSLNEHDARGLALQT